MCIAQGHTYVPPVKLERASFRPGVKHSTFEPLRSQCQDQPTHSNSSANCDVCRLVIIFANGLDPDQLGQNVGPRSGPERIFGISRLK